MERKSLNNLILISGGFDPIHSGHIKLIQESSKHGNIIILLNSDSWLERKKGKPFLPFIERQIIMNALKNIFDVISFDDSDDTCIKGIQKVINKYKNNKIIFANGGDRNKDTTPEKIFCEKNDIPTLWGMGGDNKSNSSSWILKKWKEK